MIHVIAGAPCSGKEAIREYFEAAKSGFFDAQKGANMEHKIKSCEVKSADGGSIEGYFSTWTREPDAYGDVVAKGAFLDSFERIKAEGGTIPFLWNHESDDLNAYIGTASEFGEDDHGAYFKATFDNTETAQRAPELAKDGRLAKFSFAFDVLEQGEVTLDDGRKANELRKLDLFEVSLVMYPANRDTGIIDVKSGRRHSAKDANSLQRIQELAASIQEEVSSLLAEDQVESGEDDDKAQAEDQKSQAEFTEAYRQAVKELLGVSNG